MLMESRASAVSTALAHGDVAERAALCFELEEKYHAVCDGVDHYALLEIGRRDSDEEVSASCRRLVLRFHPDRVAFWCQGDSEIRKRAHVVIAAIHEARDTLLEPDRREIYDRSLQARSNRTTGPLDTGLLRRAAAREEARPQAEPKPPARYVTAPLNGRGTDPVGPRPVMEAKAPAPRAVTGPLASAAPRPLTAPLPETATSWCARALGYAAVDDFERAARAFHMAIQLSPRDPNLYVELAGCFVRLPGRRAHAERALEEALAIEPSSVPALVAMAELYEGQNRLRDARACFMKAFAIDPNRRRAREGLERLRDAR